MEGYLRDVNVAGNAESQVKVALWLYALLVVLVTSVSWYIYWLSDIFMTRPLFAKYDQFRDLTNYIDKTAHLYRGAAALGTGLPIFTYPAPAAFVYKLLLYSFPGHPVRPFLTFLAICIVGFAFAAWRACRPSRAVGLSAATAIIVTAVLGYPMWFVADRGNIEAIVWALAAAGLCFLLRGRTLSAAVLIGLSAAIKPFTILFLLLLLRHRRYKDAAIGLATAGLMLLAAWTALGPTPWKAYQELKPGISLYASDYIMNLKPVGEMRFNHSLLDGMKSAAVTVEMGGIYPIKALVEVTKLRAEPGGWHAVRPLVDIYPFVVFAGIGLICAVFYKMPLLNQLTALSVVVTLFPPVSGEYTLLHLYVPFGALLVFATREVATGKASFSYASMLSFACIYGLLFSPLAFLMLYAGDAKLLLLLALLVVSARSPMHSEYFDGPTHEMQPDPVGKPAG
jgi:hypothetical protein